MIRKIMPAMPFGALLAAATLFASSASAVTVAYTTAGRFGTTGAFTSTASLDFVDTNTPQANSVLKFTGANFSQDVVGMKSVTFGKFELSLGGSGGAALLGQTFQLLVTQTAPSPGGTQQTSSLFSGSFIETANDSSGMQLTFLPNVFTVFGGVGGNNVVYQINTPTNVPGTISGSVTLTPGSDNPSVPLPTAAIAGSALLASVAGARRARRGVEV